MDEILIFDSYQVYYRVSGQGHPVLFLHGFLEDASIWETGVHLLKEKHQVILVDLPGHGQSNCPTTVCSMPLMAKIVDELLGELNIENPIVFGHSMGGYVGLELLKLRSAKLVLVHSNFWSDGPQKRIDRDRVVEVVQQNKSLFVKQAIPNLFYPVHLADNQDQILSLIERASGMPELAIAAATLGMRDRENNAELLTAHEITIIQGENDPIIPLEMMLDHLRLVQVKPDLRIIKECGHMGFFEQPDLFWDLVKGLIETAKTEILS